MKKKALLLTVLSLAAATFLAACGGEGGEEQHQSSKPEPALLYSVSNGGFETGDLSGWDITRGNAFSALGVTDEFFDPDSDGLVPYDKDGAYLYGRYKESATGEMLSSVFTLAGSGYMTFKIPWSLSIGYTVSIRENTDVKKFNYNTMRYPYKLTQTLNFSGSVQISDGWNISYTSGYDFVEHAISMTTVQLSRDLHCFNMACQMTLAPYTSYNFSFRCNASTLTDALKYDKRSGSTNAVQWY